MRLLTRAQPAIKLMLRASGFRLHTFETHGARLRYLEHTSSSGGGPIVFLHGIGSSAAANAKVLGALRGEARRIVALDAPGHGFSDAPREALTPELFFDCVAEALDALITEPALVVGNSLGGAVALRYAGLRPEKVRGIVATSPGGAPPDANAIDELVTRFDLSTVQAARAFVDRLYHQPPWYAPLLASDVQYIMGQPAIRQFLSSVSPAAFFTPAELSSLRMPVLLLWGQSDKLLSRSDLAFFRAHLPPSAVIEEPEHFGHSPQFEWPLELAARIARFSRELASRAAHPAA